MTEGIVYLLDASVFIQAYRQYYAFDLAPPFWASLVYHAGEGHIQSVDRVREELEKGKDDLAQWAKGVFRFAFVSSDEDDVIRSYREIMVWVQGQGRFTDAAKAEFAGGGDGWLIAYAKTKNRTVVTQEVSAPESKTKVKIPDVCRAVGVLPVDTFEMMRKLGIQFR